MVDRNPRSMQIGNSLAPARMIRRLQLNSRFPECQSLNLPQAGTQVPFESITYSSGSEFMANKRELALQIAARRERELGMAQFPKPIRYHGYCAVCRRETDFTCGWELKRTLPDGRVEPSWRERLICSHCGLSNRLRAAYHMMEFAAGFDRSKSVYLTEQTTPLFTMGST